MRKFSNHGQKQKQATRKIMQANTQIINFADAMIQKHEENETLSFEELDGLKQIKNHMGNLNEVLLKTM